MSRKLKILIMNRKFDQVFGGVEHMCTALARDMDNRGHQCDFISLDFDTAQMMYEIPQKSLWYKIANKTSDQKASWGERFERFKKIRRIIKKYDIAIGFQDGAFLSLATAAIGTGVPVIAAERNALSRFNHTSQGRWKKIRFHLFRLAKRITVQCPSYKDHYPSFLRSKIDIIANPVFQPPEEKNLKFEDREKIIISVGRLSYQKNFDVLIKAFSIISEKNLDWSLQIIGDGEEIKNLELLISQLNLQERVKLVGYKKNPSPYLYNARIFCLPSRWEGFPNALAEAMAHGLPCIGFNQCDGVSDLIQHNENGYLSAGMDDPDSLSKELEKLIMDEAQQKKLGENAKESILKYEPNKIYDQWENLFLAQNK